MVSISCYDTSSTGRLYQSHRRIEQ